ncbi:unannotated protein [freshwater metagenome]|uniref:Unannotated protein n=1 Tax=freshwater metagenome TaxID=449393 RepID=A0A6J6Q440_9ZZZZ
MSAQQPGMMPKPLQFAQLPADLDLDSPHISGAVPSRLHARQLDAARVLDQRAAREEQSETPSYRASALRTRTLFNADHHLTLLASINN